MERPATARKAEPVRRSWRPTEKDHCAYATTKAGVVGFTKSTAEALAPHDVRINAIAPGLIETEILDGVPQERLDEILVTATRRTVEGVRDLLRLPHDGVQLGRWRRTHDNVAMTTIDQTAAHKIVRLSLLPDPWQS